ncbi:MAG: hypothetical protein ABI591_05035 [Kofleriaceae bacterium]
MAAWITIYLKSPKPVPGAAAIRDAMTLPDWWTLGESVGLEEDQVDAFLAGLVWSETEVGQPDKRPLQVHEWTDPDRVRSEIAELDEIAATVVPDSVRARLEGVTTIVAIEYGIGQIGTMLEVVGFEIAYWLAAHYDGVIKSDHHAWFDHDAHRGDPYT